MNFQIPAPWFQPFIHTLHTYPVLQGLLGLVRLVLLGTRLVLLTCKVAGLGAFGATRCTRLVLSVFRTLLQFWD